MSLFVRLAAVLETLGGARPLPAAIALRTDVALLRALWWLVLFAFALAFGGHNSKFVYVDF